MNQLTSKDLDVDALLEACRIVSNGLDPSESISDLLKILVGTIGLDKVRVLLPDDAGVYKVRYHFGLTAEEIDKAEYQYGEGVTGQVAKTRKIVLIPDIKNEPRFIGKITDLSIFNETRISFIGVPIILKNQKTGVLAVNRLNADRPVLENDLVLLQFFAAFIKQALDIYELIQQRTRFLREENTRLKETLTLDDKPSDIISSSQRLLDTLDKARQCAKTDAAVLIIGESGTGKERFSQFIHKSSHRNQNNFVAINCAAIPDNLLESELFGYEKGAFTGADRLKIGKFEAADGGTLFLDEIGDMNLDVQAKLLRVLQESEITRLGSNKVIKVNVRIIAATHQDIQQYISNGRFRLDLFYRLNVITLKLPPLRERAGDIPLLVEYFLRAANRKYQKQCYFTEEAMKRLKEYVWPGNIRQLENLVERSVILSQNEAIPDSLVESGLFDDYLPRGTVKGVQQEIEPRPYQSVNKTKREEIVEAIKVSRGNKTQAAKSLGFSVRQLQYRIQKLEISERELEC